jgi:hypothetical protein
MPPAGSLQDHVVNIERARGCRDNLANRRANQARRSVLDVREFAQRGAPIVGAVSHENEVEIERH